MLSGDMIFFIVLTGIACLVALFFTFVMIYLSILNDRQKKYTEEVENRAIREASSIPITEEDIATCLNFIGIDPKRANSEALKYAGHRVKDSRIRALYLKMCKENDILY